MVATPVCWFSAMGWGGWNFLPAVAEANTWRWWASRCGLSCVTCRCIERQAGKCQRQCKKRRHCLGKHTTPTTPSRTLQHHTNTRHQNTPLHTAHVTPHTLRHTPHTSRSAAWRARPPAGNMVREGRAPILMTTHELHSKYSATITDEPTHEQPKTHHEPAPRCRRGRKPVALILETVRRHVLLKR